MNQPNWGYNRGRDRTRLDLNPVEPPPPAPLEETVSEPVVDPDRRRLRVVNAICTVIMLICGLFAAVLALHIVLVLGEANPNNGFASFVDSWAAGVSLGLRGLFVPDNAKLQVLFNDGLAAILWLVLGSVLKYLIRRFTLPGTRRAARYRVTH